MNRLILIGNGFDKAHGLATSYQEFIDWYWDTWRSKLAKSDKKIERDALCSFKLKADLAGWYLAWGYHYGINIGNLNGIKLRDFLESDKFGCEFKQCLFLKKISQSIESKGWVDIEEEYYTMLKTIRSAKSVGDYTYFGHPEKLNAELLELTKYLVDYLSDIQNNSTYEPSDGIERLFYSPILSRDISVSRLKEYDNHIINNLKLDRPQIAKLNKRYYGYDVEDQMQKLEEFKRNDYDETTRYNKIINNRFLLESLSFPNKILVLNFNYTNTESLYVKDKEGVDVVHIHGDLAHPENIIFGYGDELDDDYKDMQKTNNNEYLKNIKSIRYLESERYREVLKFIESSPYQIYVLGHSCGTSDRTLLNTLFEHRNCISIKPYFYQKDGNDNYLDIIENISRNFTDMKLMRDLVVNKTFCSPLPQVNKY